MKKVLGIIAIVLCFALVGCGFGTDDKTENQSTQNTPVETSIEEKNVEESNSSIEVTDEELELWKTYAPEDYNSAKELANSMELSSDNNQYVWQIDETTKAIYHHDGTNITGYEIIIDYENAEEAELAKTTYTDYEEDDVESVERKDNTLVITFKPEAYEGTTLEEIKQSFSFIQLLQGE